jgi:hypothetical protein
VGWLTYREPEDHLDDLADQIAQLPDLPRDGLVLGITSKDVSLLDRLAARGFQHLHTVSIADDLKIDLPTAFAETLQERFDVEAAIEIRRRRGPASLVVVRHVFEHAFQLQSFRCALRTLLAPNGYLLVEVPDCKKAIEAADYSTIWEEHSVYFTSATLQRALSQDGLEIHSTRSFPYPFENSLVAICRSSPSAAGSPPPATPEEIAEGAAFGAGFGRKTKDLRSALQSQLGGRRAALFGAGHLACAFIHYHGLHEFFAAALDDDPHKQGLFLANTDLKIFPSSALVDLDVPLCVTCFPPEIEERAIGRRQDFVRQGGSFASMFPSSTRYLLPRDRQDRRA